MTESTKCNHIEVMKAYKKMVDEGVHTAYTKEEVSEMIDAMINSLEIL